MTSLSFRPGQHENARYIAAIAAVWVRVASSITATDGGSPRSSSNTGVQYRTPISSSYARSAPHPGRVCWAGNAWDRYADTSRTYAIPASSDT